MLFARGRGGGAGGGGWAMEDVGGVACAWDDECWSGGPGFVTSDFAAL